MRVFCVRCSSNIPAGTAYTITADGRMCKGCYRWHRESAPKHEVPTLTPSNCTFVIGADVDPAPPVFDANSPGDVEVPPRMDPDERIEDIPVLNPAILDPAHERMVEEFSGGPNRELIPCDGDPECTWAAKHRSKYGRPANYCAHHWEQCWPAGRTVSAGGIRDAAFDERETGPSAVASAPAYRGGVQVYCQGEDL